MNKRTLCRTALSLGLLTLAASAWSQAAYPNKPVKLVVGFAPGGAADYVARTVGDALGRALGQSVVVENKAGAGSSIGADAVAKAAPDGYTVFVGSPAAISVNPALNPKLPYKAADLLPVSKITSSPLVIAVNPNLGINSVKDLIARAKAEPGKINYATSGNGSAPHLGAALFGLVAGVQMQHIPFRGGAPAIQSVIAGDTQVTFGTPPSVLPQVSAGRLKGLGVSTRERTQLVPDLPGMQEAGLPDYVIDFWYGLFVPAGTPQPVVQKLFTAAQEALKQPQVKAALAREGTDVSLSRTPADFAGFLAQDEKFWVNLVRSAGVKAE